MNKICILLVFLFSTYILISAQNYTVSGYITVEQSGETLINATVFDLKSEKGTLSNPYGFYSITLPGEEVQLQYSYVGLTPHICSFKLVHDTVINIKLTEVASLNEVVVFGNHREGIVKSSQISAVNISVNQIKSVPSLMGETDVIKALQLLPGVKSGAEGSAGMYVRGGGPDENLLILDGVPVYNVNHMLGFFSVFNADAIKDVTLYKGGFPARFGGRLSSVVDVRMKDGNENEIHGNLSVGLISSKLNLEGPIIKGKTTFNISARRTYADILARPFISKIAEKQNGGAKGTTLGYYFYDLNGKISHKFSDENRLFLSVYMGDDVIFGDMQQYQINNGGGSAGTQAEIETGRLKLDWNWGNLVTALRWNHIVNNKLFMNVTSSYSRYRFDLHQGTQVSWVVSDPPSVNIEESNIKFKSGISDFTAKVDFDWSPAPNHDIKFGTAYTRHGFRPGINIVQQKSTNDSVVQQMDTTYGDKRVDAHEMIAYIEDNISLNRLIDLNIGLHYSSFQVQGRFYNPLPQPRVGLRVLFNNQLSFKAGYASMSQYIHLLSNSNISLPTDLWVPVTKKVPPMRSEQYSAGIFYNFRNLFDCSIETYYKTMDNIIEYKDGASFFGASTGWEDKVNMGKGWAYGIELFVRKSVGKTTGWVGYTWSRTKRLFDLPGQEINYGEVFSAKYDRPHDLSIVLFHRFNEKFDIGGTWVFNSGNLGTIALQHFEGAPVPQHSTGMNDDDTKLSYISSRNNYRYDAYHRLDLSVNFHKQKKHGVRTWNISIYNAYNHLNSFLVTITQEKKYDSSTGESKTTKHLTKISIFPVIPSISYSYKF
jgi:hypothetical protein